MPARADVIAAARKYMGMPYRHQGRSRPGSMNPGLDCIGIALCLADDLGLVDAEGNRFGRYMYANYARAPLGEEVQDACKRHLIVKRADPPFDLAEVLPGDVITVRAPTVITHLAVVSDLGYALGMIHSYNSVRRIVVENLIDAKWARRIAGIFSFPGVE